MRKTSQGGKRGKMEGRQKEGRRQRGAEREGRER